MQAASLNSAIGRFLPQVARDGAPSVAAQDSGSGFNLPFDLPKIPGLTDGPGFPGIPGLGAGLKLDFKVNDRGRIEANNTLLGRWVPFKAEIDPDEVLAGNYGRRIDVDMRQADNTLISGDVRLGGLPIGVPAVDIGGSKLADAFSTMRFQIPAPNKVLFDGGIRKKTGEMPIHAEIDTTKVANGIYDLDVKALRLGEGQWPVPAFLATFCTWFVLKVMRGMPGVTMAGLGRLRVDLRAAINTPAAPPV